MSTTAAPSDYWIEERDDDMLIVAKHWQWGKMCVARRPKALTNEAWRPTAEKIVAALSTTPCSPSPDESTLTPPSLEIAMVELSEVLAALPTNERRYLSRRVCGFCDGRMLSAQCSAIWEKCSEQDRLHRLTRCLAEYKPRGERKDG